MGMSFFLSETIISQVPFFSSAAGALYLSFFDLPFFSKLMRHDGRNIGFSQTYQHQFYSIMHIEKQTCKYTNTTNFVFCSKKNPEKNYVREAHTNFNF
jgi:hypothetical protein